MTHYKAILTIQNRITELQAEIKNCEKIIDEPEMMSDYYCANNDIENFKLEIAQLTTTMQFLLKNN